MRNRLLLGGWGVPLWRLAGSSGASRRGHISPQRNRLSRRPVLGGLGIAVVEPVVGVHCRRVEFFHVVFGPVVARWCAVYRRGGARNNVATAGLRGGWPRRRVRAIDALQIQLPFIHATRMLAPPLHLAAAFCFHIVVAEAQFVAQLPVRVGCLSNFDWRIWTAYLDWRIWAVPWR